MSFHPITKNGKGSIGPIPQKIQNKLLAFPGVSTAEDAPVSTPTPEPAKPETKQESNVDLWYTLYTANDKVELECYKPLIFKGVTGYSWEQIYDLLDVPETENSPFPYMGNMARLHIAVAYELTRHEVARLNRPMSLDEIYACCEKNAQIAGHQARMMCMIMRIDLLSGESLEG
jgi:hypothetical protein